MTPFKAVYVRDPRYLLKYESGSTSNDDLEHKLMEQDEILALLKEHIHKAQETMKKQVDGHQRDVCSVCGG